MNMETFESVPMKFKKLLYGNYCKMLFYACDEAPTFFNFSRTRHELKLMRIVFLNLVRKINAFD